MTEASWPFYGVETNEAQFSKWARLFAYSGVSTGLEVSPGTGLEVIVSAGSGLVQGVYYENSADKALTIASAPGSGQTRKDAVVLRLDQTANTITAEVVTGTANGSGGALPTLEQTDTTWETLIAVITVGPSAAAITTGNINETRPSLGLRVHAYETGDQPTPESAPALGVNISTDVLELWDGSSWTPLVSASLLQGTVPVSKGGTGAANAADARSNLGAAAEGHTHTWASITGKPSTFAPSAHEHSAADITSGTLAVARGGTGKTSYETLREALDIYVQPSAPSHKAGRVWIPGTSL